ncbi:glucosyl-3-phosphoglycerate synthase [Janibacter sp. G1551]|uniref:glucosyl-3-phosphoglycerate synthase n=1 Tax=Janibacter sp. G1551 TaxID=3420440 RepID=UPI003D01F6D3
MATPDDRAALPPRRWQDWAPEGLARAKVDRGLSVSVVIPARNEARTVGDVVARIHADLVEAVPLVDELVVIDSDSSDDTARVAREAGARVHPASALGPAGLAPVPGKGEALWKSLFATSGDLLVFVDADLTEWGTHFVTGLLGPLLDDPAVALVKGSYRRLGGGGHDHDPGAGGAGAAAGAGADVPRESHQGGRVTELVARPLLNLWWPELSAVRQPLAGEWAIRRSALETLSVPTGYGVEIAVLLDVYARYGLGAIGQVELGRRGHDHQRLSSLGAMAMEVLAVADRRRGTGGAGDEVQLTQYGTESIDGRTVRRVSLVERPPALSVPEYAMRERVS